MRKVLLPIRKALKAGISIERMAVSLALGITVGLIPLYGFTTLIVTGIALSLRLNFVAMQVAHYIVQPLQIALLIPFLKLGEMFIKGSEFTFTFQQYIQLFHNDFWGALKQLWLLNLSAVFIWMILSLPLFFLLYYSLTYTIRKLFPLRVRKVD